MVTSFQSVRETKKSQSIEQYRRNEKEHADSVGSNTIPKMMSILSSKRKKKFGNTYELSKILFCNICNSLNSLILERMMKVMMNFGRELE